MSSRPVRFLNEILRESFAFRTGLENDDLRLVSRTWTNIISKSANTLPMRNFAIVKIQSRWELDENKDDNPTEYSAEIETDFNEKVEPPTTTVSAYSTKYEHLFDKIIPFLRNSFVATFEIDIDHMTAPMCQRLQEVSPSMSIQWLDFQMTNLAAPAAVFHALIGSFREINDVSLASMRLSSDCVSRGLLEAFQASGAYEISLPISLPADYKKHYELRIRDLVDFVFGRCGQRPSIYVAARRLSPSENVVEEFAKIKSMPQEYAATLLVSGIGLTDTQKKELTDADVDYEPASKKRRAERPVVDYVFKNGHGKDICVMRRKAQAKSFKTRSNPLKRSLENILS